MISVMTIIALLLLLIGLVALLAWASRDQLSTKSRPTWFD